MSRLDHLRIFILILGTVLITSFGCSHPSQVTPSTATSGPIVAKADRGYSLTQGELLQKLRASMLMPNGGYLSDSAMAGFLDSVLVDTLTGFDADGVDLRKNFAHFWSLRTRTHALLLYTYMESHLSGISADSSEIQAYYDQHKDRYELKEQVEVSHILSAANGLLYGPDSLSYRIQPESVLQRSVHDYIELVRRKLDSGMAFPDAAAQFSHSRGAADDKGYLGQVGRGEIHPPFDSIAFALEPGTYSAPYEDRDGWHIVYLHRRIPAGLRPLSDTLVYANVAQIVLNEKMRNRANAVFDSLAQGIKVVVNESLVDSNFYHTTDSLWFGIVNDVDTVDVLTMRNAEDAIKSRLRVWNTTPEQKRQVLNAIARQLCVVQAARHDRLDTLPTVRNKIAEMRHQESKVYLQEQWFDLLWSPSDSAIEQYYETHPKEFIIEKPLTVQQIVVKDSTLAIFLRDQARSGIDFMDLAKEYYPGEESIRAELADLGAIGPRDVDSNFYRAAASLAVGDVSEPVKTRYGFHIIKLLKRQESRTLDDARVDITARLTKEFHMAGFWKIRDALFAKYRVKISNLPKKVFVEPVANRKK